MELMVGNTRLEVAMKSFTKLPPSRLCKVCHLLTLVHLKLVNVGLFMADVYWVYAYAFRGGLQGGVYLLFAGTNLNKILQHLVSDKLDAI